MKPPGNARERERWWRWQPRKIGALCSLLLLGMVVCQSQRRDREGRKKKRGDSGEEIETVERGFDEVARSKMRIGLGFRTPPYSFITYFGPFFYFNIYCKAA